jgi:site-specific recombinase XerD
MDPNLKRKKENECDMTDKEKYLEDLMVKSIKQLLKEKEKSVRTIKAYNYDIGILKIFQDKHNHGITLLKVSPESLNRYYEYLQNERKFSESTIIRNLRNLKNFYRYAVGQGFVSSNPFDNLEIPLKLETKYSTEETMLSLDNITSIFKAAKNRCQRDYCIILLLMVARMLPQDIRKLEWSFIGIDVLENPCIKMKSRSIEKSYLLSEELFTELLKLKKDGKVFLSNRGNPISESALRKIVYDIGKAAGLEKKISPMMLVHNNVTLARMAGATDDEIMNQAGFRFKSELKKYSDFKPVVGVADKIPINKIINRISKNNINS